MLHGGWEVEEDQEEDGGNKHPDANLKNLNEEADTTYKHIASNHTSKGPPTDQ